MNFVNFTFYCLVLLKFTYWVISLESEKMCRDASNCQLYFPCKFIEQDSYFDQEMIKKCSDDFIFNEEEQKCIEPDNLEDFQCLLLSAYLEDSNDKLNSTQTTKFFNQTKSDSSILNDNENENENTNDKNKSKSSSLLDGEIINVKKRTAKKVSKQIEEDYDNDYENDETYDDSDAKYSNNNGKDYKRMCVVTNWSQFRPGRGKFQFEFIDPNLCNFIVYSSVRISEDDGTEYEGDSETDSEEYTIKSVQHNDQELYSRLHHLRSKHSSLKLILRITDDSGRLYSKLSKRFDTRSSFIRNTIDYIQENKFDGIEIEWRWPNGPAGGPTDKENFAILLKDFRSRMGSKYILGVILSPLTERIQNSYSLLDINNNVDYANVEAFDYYGPWDKKTGIMAPLGKMNEQFLLEAYMNIEGTISYMKALGLSSEKTVLGLTTYSRTFLLQHPAANLVNAPTVGNGFSGTFTKTNGMLSYYELCECRKKANWKEKWHELALAPFMYNSDNEWVSYENEESLSKKIEFVKSNELAGASVYAIDMDDFRGVFCNQGSYPFLRFSLGLLSGHQNSSKKQTTQVSTTETTTTTTTTTTKKTTQKTMPKVRLKISPTVNSRLLIKNTRKTEKAIATTKSTKKNTSSKKTKIDATPKQPKVAKITTKSPKQQVSHETKKFLGYILITPPTLSDTANKNRPSANTNDFESRQQNVKNSEQEKSNFNHEQLKMLNKMFKKKGKSQYQNLISLPPIKENGQWQIPNNVEFEINPKLSNKIVKKEERSDIYQDQSLPKFEVNAIQNVEEPKLQPILPQPIQPQIQNNYNQILNDPIVPANILPQSFPTTNQYPTFWSSPQLNFFFPTLAPSFKTKCDDKKSGIYRNEYDCSSFYICEISSSIRVHEFKCPLGLVFNMVDCTCDWPSANSPCIVPLFQSFCKEAGQNSQKLASNGDNSNTQIINSQPWFTEKFSCQNKEQGIYRDQFDCTKFYICQNVPSASISLKHDFNCPNGLHFNLNICKCDWPSTTSCQSNLFTFRCY